MSKIVQTKQNTQNSPNYKHRNVFCIYKRVFKQTLSLCLPLRSTRSPEMDGWMDEWKDGLMD